MGSGGAAGGGAGVEATVAVKLGEKINQWIAEWPVRDLNGSITGHRTLRPDKCGVV